MGGLRLSVAMANAAALALAKLYNARAYCSAKLEKFDAAVADYTEALRLDPANAHALHNRGISYDRLGRDDEAARDFERALELENS